LSSDQVVEAIPIWSPIVVFVLCGMASRMAWQRGQQNNIVERLLSSRVVGFFTRWRVCEEMALAVIARR
jgi:hypothetical protein